MSIDRSPCQPIIVSSRAGPNKAVHGIERPCRGVVGRHFEDDAAPAATADLGAKHLEESRADAGTAPLGHDAEGDDLELIANAGGEREPDRLRNLPGNQTKKTGKHGDL